jgi:hypothetical protein
MIPYTCGISQCKSLSPTMINIMKMLEGIKIAVKQMTKGLDPLEWLLIDLIVPKSNFDKAEGMVTVRNSVDFTAPGAVIFISLMTSFMLMDSPMEKIL